MEYNEYKRIYNRLNCFNDIEELRKEGYDNRLITTLYTQKTSRDVKKRFHIVKNNSKRLLKEWKNGKTMMELANSWRFPPVMLAMFLFLQDGASKKEFWDYVNNPNKLRADVAAELIEAVEKDPVYSPAGMEAQRQRGIWGETLLQNWLDEQGIGYRTEDDLRGEYRKTPDVLFDEPMLYEGRLIYWIESKASFGDNNEFKFNARRQLVPYTEMFGPGVVVYWVGKLDDLEEVKDVYVEDISIIERKLRQATRR